MCIGAAFYFLMKIATYSAAAKEVHKKIGRKEKKWRLQQQIDSIQFLLLIFDFAIPKMHFINQKNWLKMFSKNKHNFKYIFGLSHSILCPLNSLNCENSQFYED